MKQGPMDPHFGTVICLCPITVLQAPYKVFEQLKIVMKKNWAFQDKSHSTGCK